MINQKRTIQNEVAAVIARVERQGDKALEFFLKKFDKIRLSSSHFLIPQRELKSAYHRISPQNRAALIEAKKRISFFHREELKGIRTFWKVDSHGIHVGQKAAPLERVGIYVPGGRTCYPSTVLMTAIPAKTAGVREVVMVTPPKNVRDEVLAAAYISGVDFCFKAGGPAAIAALAYGTRTIPRVEKIVGPGNRYVAEAKRQVFGIVGIDSLAGPSEVVVCADRFSDILKVSLNLLAQTEHDPDAVGYLLVSEERVARNVRTTVQDLLKKKPLGFKPDIRYEVRQDVKGLVRRVNQIAPEHLLLALKNPKSVLPGIRNAGAVFLNENSPVPLGDYAAGPSHVLPTGGTAAFSSGLSVKDFLKWSSWIEARPEKSKKAFRAAQKIAQIENLHYHALSLESGL